MVTTAQAKGTGQEEVAAQKVGERPTRHRGACFHLLRHCLAGPVCEGERRESPMVAVAAP